MLIWGLVHSIVFLSPLAYPDWPAASFFNATLVEDTQQVDFFNLFIPSNPFSAYANAMVPAIVVFSILLGVALTGLRNKAEILGSLTVLLEAMMEITKLVAKL